MQFGLCLLARALRCWPLVAVGACSKIGGFDEYGVGPASGETPAAARSIDSRPECVACFERECTAELEACNTDAVCSSYVACVRRCGDPVCRMSCIALDAPPDGVTFVNHLYGCAASRCDERCPFGTNFACVEDYRVAQPYAGRDRISLSFNVLFSPAQTPAQDVRAQACLLGSGCDTSVAEGLVVDGRVTLSVPPTNTKGFLGPVLFTDERADAGSADGGITEGPLLPTMFGITFWSLELGVVVIDRSYRILAINGDELPVSIVGTESVLVVEDEPSVRAVAVRALLEHGFYAVEAGSAEEALAVLSARDGAVNMVVTDVVMRGMGGRELARRIRQNYPGAPCTPHVGIRRGSRRAAILTKALRPHGSRPTRARATRPGTIAM